MTGEEKLLNEVFLYLYKVKNKRYLLNDLSSLPQFAMSPDIMIRLLNTLIKNEFVYPDIQNFDGVSYQISSLGIIFIEKLPHGFTDKPYQYHLHLREEKQEIDYKIKRLTIYNYKWSFVIAILTTFFIGVTAYHEVIDKSGNKIATKLQLLSLQVQNMPQTLDSILLSHKVLKVPLDSLP